MRLKSLVRAGLLQVFNRVSKQLGPDDVLALCYHSVDDREDFRRQMEWLALSGCRVMSVVELLRWLRGESKLNAPGVVLTFDDCYASQYHNAFPELLAFNLPAVFFPVVRHLGTESAWEHESSRVSDMPLMDQEQLLELSRAGYAIGCHTQSHPHLTRLNIHEAREEIVSSRRALQDLFRQPVEVFCYPYGDHSDAVVDLVREAGFAAAFTVEMGTLQRESDPFRLERLPILGPLSRVEFGAYLSGAIVPYRRLRARLGV